MVDVYSMEVLVPSLVMIVAMTGAMVWGFFKVRGLMNQDQNK
ncbi:hypothetical protein [Neptuniibacter halophilus]|nr:hypothetical protein [Neptuniibacter halophilus]